jgi:hypothetical protein
LREIVFGDKMEDRGGNGENDDDEKAKAKASARLE